MTELREKIISILCESKYWGLGKSAMKDGVGSEVVDKLVKLIEKRVKE